MSNHSALILDRDGTLNAMVCNPQGDQDSPYFSSQLEIYPGLGDLLRPWTNSGIPIFVVTNQPGIAKGHFKREDLLHLNSVLMDRLLKEGVKIQDIFSCIHHPVGTQQGDQSLIGPCECRKPKPGMLHELHKKHRIDLAKAIFIGDSDVDQKAAKAAGVGTFILVKTLISATVPIEKQNYSFPNAPTLRSVLEKLS